MDLSNVKMKSLMEYMLSGDDLKTLFPYAKVIKHNQIRKVKNYKQLFDSGALPNFTFMLYTSKLEGNTSVGHWVLLLDKGDEVIVFDPYGEETLQEQFDEYQGTISSHLRERPYLLELLKNLESQGIKISVSHPDYQRLETGINTCGRHCVIRALHEKLSNEQYKEWVINLCLKLNMKPDEMITLTFYKRYGF